MHADRENVYATYEIGNDLGCLYVYGTICHLLLGFSTDTLGMVALNFSIFFFFK